MKRLLLLLLGSVSFISAEQMVTRLLEVSSKYPHKVAFTIYRADKSRRLGPLLMNPGQQNWKPDFAINPGETLAVVANGGQVLAKYSPSGNTPYVDLIISSEGHAEIRPVTGE